MKNIYKTIVFTLLSATLFTSCDELDTTDDVVLDRNQKPVVNVTTSASMVVPEGQSNVITITTDRPTTNDQIFKLVQVSGNGESGVDYSFSSYSALDYGVVGGRIFIPAFETTGSVTISSLVDTEVDNKSAVFELRSIESMLGVVGDQNRVNLDIEDVIFCAWTLEMTDSYGDSWNDATVTLTSAGETTVYANEDLDGVTGSETQTVDIFMAEGDDYSFSFTSGDWDSEVSYILTAPDGTVFSDGPSPTVGVITSGILDCP